MNVSANPPEKKLWMQAIHTIAVYDGQVSHNPSMRVTADKSVKILCRLWGAMYVV